MNSDYIGGTAILDLKPGTSYLYCYGVRDGKPATFICIPVRQRGTPETSCTWEYDIQGDELHVTPSVRQMGGSSGSEIFHNGYDWRVKFKMKDKDAYQELRALNPALTITA